MSLEELDQIVDSAPDGAQYYLSLNEKYYKFHDCKGWIYSTHGWITRPELYNLMKGAGAMIRLSVIRSRIAELEKHYDQSRLFIKEPMVDLELKAPEPKLHWFLIGYNWRGNSGSGFGNLRIPSLTKEVYERDFKTIKDDIQSTHALCLEIVVLSISYLGHMTNTEFYQQPDSEEL